MRYRIEPRTPSFGETMQNGVEQSAKSAALITGGLVLGGVALGAAAVKSRRTRLKLMGVLHFPVSFFIASMVLVYPAIRILNAGSREGVDTFCPWCQTVGLQAFPKRSTSSRRNNIACEWNAASSR